MKVKSSIVFQIEFSILQLSKTILETKMSHIKNVLIRLKLTGIEIWYR